MTELRPRRGGRWTELLDELADHLRAAGDPQVLVLVSADEAVCARLRARFPEVTVEHHPHAPRGVVLAYPGGPVVATYGPPDHGIVGP